MNLNLSDSVRSLASRADVSPDDLLKGLCELCVSGDVYSLSPMSIMRCETELVVAVTLIAHRFDRVNGEAVMLAVTFVNALIGIAAKWTLGQTTKDQAASQVDSLLKSMFR